MIRMGRSTNTTTKPEAPQQQQTDIANFDQPKTNQPFNFNQSQSDTSAPLYSGGGSSRVFSESEGMARDIKEGRLSGYVGSGTTLKGDTEFKSMLRVDGHLIGTITSEAGTLHIGASGTIDANISVAAAVIHGTINGDITATEKIELGRTAKVVGNIQTPSLMIETGAVFEGNCSMMKSKADFDKRMIQSVVETSKPESKSYVETKPETVKVEAGAASVTI